MGKGNPEVADAVIARDSKVFIADKLSSLNKSQLDSLKIHWVALRDENGFMRFKDVLENLKIPFKLPSKNDVNNKLSKILNNLFDVQLRTSGKL